MRAEGSEPARGHRRKNLARLALQAIAATWIGSLAPPALSTEIAWIWPSSGAPASGYDEMAVVVESLLLRGTAIERMPRLGALALPPGARLTPVIHVRSSADTAEAFSDAQRRAVLEAVDRHARESTSRWLQLDFEAPSRQRNAYVALVHDIHRRLPAGLRLSVTVLASWCAQGDWLDKLDADEFVPMLYRLGPDAARWRARWTDARSSLAPRCLAGASGYSLQEPLAPALRADGARHYWFNERNWSRPSQFQ